MAINPNIKFGVLESGHYFLDFIPVEQISRYVDRIENYHVRYELSEYELICGQNSRENSYCITFFELDSILQNKLKDSYGFFDRREYSLPVSEEITYFKTNESLIIGCPCNFLSEIRDLKNYLGQHKQLEYLTIYPRGYAIFRASNAPIAVAMEITAICQMTYESNKQKILEIQDMITKYDSEKYSMRVKNPVFRTSWNSRF